ncbi:MAG: thioredoxin fold domain-containing protein [Candidatus Hydrogenedens sp.]|nr:thioredoxin family protein [Candidatus Hydrogenedentota bacterium]NLF58819.1 thioredoxin fold domain-containing protein [Candidatus Hydrogenedens sp.]
MRNKKCTRLHVAFVTAFLFAALGAEAQLGGAGPRVNYTAKLETGTVRPGEVFRAAVTFTLSRGWHVNSRKPLEDYLIPTELTLEPGGPFTLRRVAYPEHQLLTFSFSPDPMALYEETFSIGVEAVVDESAAPGDYVWKGALRYQACNDKVCSPPAERPFELAVTVSPPDAPAAAAVSGFPAIKWDTAESVGDSPTPDGTVSATQPEDSAPSPTQDWRALAEQFTMTGQLAGFADKKGFLDFVDAAERGETTKNTLAGRSLLVLVLLVLGGGLLLNLTPCVLPLIPINVAIIGAGARAGSRTRGFLLGGAYGAGIALVYGVLGLVVVLGLSTAFGAINSTVWFNAAITALFVVLGLAMFDLIQIDFSRFQAKVGIRKNEHGSFAVALFMGAVSALLAGACVAPVVIYTILHAQDLYSQGNGAAILLPFLLGAGMALPWPFLGAGLSFLPKPGKWMVRVKQAFGVFILGFALYYGSIAWSLMGMGGGAVEDSGGWVHSLEEGLEQAQRENKPVVIDFWATWCKNCSIMDKTVLKDPEVLERLAGYVRIKYQAEELTQSPAREVTEYFQVLGLPTFVILEPDK